MSLGGERGGGGGGVGEIPKGGARREDKITGDLAPGGRDHGGRNPWDTGKLPTHLSS